MLNKILFNFLITTCNIIGLQLAESRDNFNHPLITKLNDTNTNATKYVIIDIAAAAPVFWLLLIPIGVVGCCWLAYRCCSGSPRRQPRVFPQPQDWTGQDSENTHLVQCYLCFAKVTTELWKSGQHRMECSVRLNHKLQCMPRSRSIFCLSCGEKMRQWPWKGPEFACDSGVSHICLSSGGHLISNTGGNRFNCFICDIDYCTACVHTMETFRKYNYNTFSFLGETSHVPAPSAPRQMSSSSAGYLDDSPPSYSEAMSAMKSLY